MSTLAEIQAALETLPPRQKQQFLSYLARELGQASKSAPRKRRALKAAARPALEGLPPDLSTGTKDRVRALIAQRNVTHR